MTQATEMLQVMNAPGKAKGKTPTGLKADDLKTMFRAMLETRLLDQRGMNLQRQGRIGFYVPSFGQEASQIGAGYAMADSDLLFPSYRVVSIALLRNIDLRILFDQALLLFLRDHAVCASLDIPC